MSHCVTWLLTNVKSYNIRLKLHKHFVLCHSPINTQSGRGNPRIFVHCFQDLTVKTNTVEPTFSPSLTISHPHPLSLPHPLPTSRPPPCLPSLPSLPHPPPHPHLPGPVANGLQGCPSYVVAISGLGESNDHASCGSVPVGCVQAVERRHKVHTTVAGHTSSQVT